MSLGLKWVSCRQHTYGSCFYIHSASLCPLVKVSEVAQSCPTLCDPMDCSPPGSSVHGIFQARGLEWIAISFSRGSSQPRRSNPGLPHCRHSLPSEPPGKQISDMKWSEVKWSCSVVPDSVTPWTVTYWAPLSMGFSRREYCSGLPFPSPEDLPESGIKPRSPAL